jgi:polyvinyl alcohol dehydrogenase (cytochrome)
VTRFARGTMGLAAATLVWGQAEAPKAAGEAVYRQRCAGCHEQTNPRIPPRTALNQMPAERILRTLDFGAMMTVAYPMSRAERQAVAAYIGTSAPAVGFPPSAWCADRRVTVSDRPKTAWNGWSPASNNTRYQSAHAAGLSINQVRNLKLKWHSGSMAM